MEGLGFKLRFPYVWGDSVDDINPWHYLKDLKFYGNYGIYSLIWVMQDVYHQRYFIAHTTSTHPPPPAISTAQADFPRCSYYLDSIPSLCGNCIQDKFGSHREVGKLCFFEFGG